MSVGDTISFQKGLSDYPASGGWALEYIVSGDIQFTFNSTPIGDSHQLTVAAAVTATWVSGAYELTGFAINAGTGERIQIYQAPLVLRPNVPAGDAQVKTHAQNMLELTEKIMLGQAHDILESDVEGTRIKRLTKQQLREEHAYWFQKRQNEIDGERAAAGLPNRNKIKPRFQVVNPGVPIGFGPPIFPRP